MPEIKFFCDESCHLQHDGSDIMVLGALSCPTSEVERIIRQVKSLRHHHNYNNELKWTKLIARQAAFYHDLIDLFFTEGALQFKATVVKNKQNLDHNQFNQGSHNDFYYKMFYYTLRDYLIPQETHKVYLDYMDTHGRDKVKKLKEVFYNESRGQKELKCYIIRSHESQLIQLCDLLIGAIAYKNRSDIPHSSTVKSDLVTYIEQKACQRLDAGTPPWERKFNIFQFRPRGLGC